MPSRSECPAAIAAPAKAMASMAGMIVASGARAGLTAERHSIGVRTAVEMAMAQQEPGRAAAPRAERNANRWGERLVPKERTSLLTQQSRQASATREALATLG